MKPLTMNRAVGRHGLARPRREKLFGDGRPRPLDRNAKVRIMVFARALTRRTEAGKHYGVITAKFVAVLEALLWGFHNAGTGRCFPSYETIAERAACARSTVYEAIRALELAGVLTWVNRLARVREYDHGERDLFGRPAWRWRVIRTSNAYAFTDPNAAARSPDSSKSEFPTGTTIQDSILERSDSLPRELEDENPLHRSLMRLAKALESGRAR